MLQTNNRLASHLLSGMIRLVSAGMASSQSPSVDPRIVRSENAIREALFARLREGQSFTAMTVSEVADAAGVTRKTFYARFGSLEQVIERVVLDLFTEIAGRIEDKQLQLPLRDNSLAMLVFRSYEEFQDSLSLVVSCCPANLVVEPLSAVARQLLNRAVDVNAVPAIDEVQSEYLTAAMAGVVHGVLSVWVRRGFSESPEQVAVLVDALVSDGLQKLVLRGDAPA